MSPQPTRYELAGRLRLHADSVQRLAQQLAAYSPYRAAAADLANAAAMMHLRANAIAPLDPCPHRADLQPQLIDDLSLPPLPRGDVRALLKLLALATAGTAAGHDPTQWMTPTGRAYWEAWLVAREQATITIAKVFPLAPEGV
ncbi:hypothetical protein [uncultured Lamprocystis sp.]|jgi:hypothetical protein|uniref:hypothetical protein n=1 Tax=uncultured Lamprocystis sp. TaxID=543132 RepID=UPI0025EDF8B7|nr:hypothetical protein [uncultured Lamprocystis sp.]